MRSFDCSAYSRIWNGNVAHIKSLYLFLIREKNSGKNSKIGQYLYNDIQQIAYQNCHTHFKNLVAFAQIRKNREMETLQRYNFLCPLETTKQFSVHN